MRRRPSSLIIITLIGLLSCSGSATITVNKPTLPPLAGSGQIRLVMTDFPVSGRDVAQVNVQIMRIEVQQAGWNTVIDFGANGRMFDLLQLQNGNTAELGAFYLAAGSYNQMRLILGTNNTVYVNEGSGYVTKPLQTPGAQTSGVKITSGFTITDQGYTTLLLDFDASQSVKYAGNKYQLSPTIRVLSADTSQAFFSLTPTAVAGQNLTPPLATGITTDTSLAVNGLMALRSMNVGNNVALNSNAYVLGSCDASAINGCLAENLELQVGTNSVQGTAYVARADRVSIGVGSTIQYATGAVPGVPDFQKGQVGLKNVSAADSPLAPNLYFALSVAAGATLNLTGGNYHLDSITLGNNATLNCLDACIVMVKTMVMTGTGAVITASNNDSNSFYIFAAGKNGQVTNPNAPGNVADSQKAVAFGSGNAIRANIIAPYGTLSLGSSTQFSGYALAHEISVGDGSTITGRAAQIAFSGDYSAQAAYKGEALQYHFTGDTNTVRMLSSAQPQYIFHGTYSYNIITKQAFVTYDTVDLIDPDCIPCQSTGIYPPIATYAANGFYISPTVTGFELVSYDSTSIQARVLLDPTIVTFMRRSIFGPFDQ